MQAYTQPEPGASAHSRPTKRLRSEGPLREEEFSNSVVLTKDLVMYCINSKAVHSIEAQAASKKFEKDSTAAFVQAAVNRVLQLLEGMGLAKRGGRGGTLKLLRPPAIDRDHVADLLTKLLGKPEKDVGVLLETMNTREESSTWDLVEFEERCTFLERVLKPSSVAATT